MFFGPNVRSEEIFCEIRLEGSREGGAEEKKSGGKGLGGRVPIKSS